MALNIKDPETDRLARELATATGESLTSAVALALRERLERVRGRTSGLPLTEQIEAIARRCASLPVTDTRDEDSILGLGIDGLPTDGP